MDTLAFIKNQNETIAQLIVGQISEASYNICGSCYVFANMKPACVFPPITQKVLTNLKINVHRCTQITRD